MFDEVVRVRRNRNKYEESDGSYERKTKTKSVYI